MNGKVVIITGAAGGIGSAVARLLYGKGASVVLSDVDTGRMEALASSLGERALAVKCDITRPAEVKGLVKKALSAYGRIDVLVNNAGIIVPRLFEDCGVEEIEKQVNVNLMGPLLCTREVVKVMKGQGGGSIVTISSMAGIVPETRSSIYTATKFALRGWGLTLHIELKKHGISVSTVFPNSVDTPMLRFEAGHDGSPLTFLSPPLTPETIAGAVHRAILTRKPEICVPAGEGFSSRLVMAFPRVVAWLWPKLEMQGARNKTKMEKKGII